MYGLIYRDLSGRARPRRFVIAALIILALLAIAAAWLARRPASSYVPARRAAPAQSFAPAALITSAPTATNVPSIAACPTDPADWYFIAVFPEDHYRRIEPACALEGLEQVAAWMLLARLGYSKPDAAGLLGLETVPWTPLLSMEGYTNLKGPLTLTLLPEWPAHPDFRFWQVDRDGAPAVAISLRGCYSSPDPRTAVICVLALDRGPGSAVSVLGEHRFASHAAHLPGSRSFQLVGYTIPDGWRLLGQVDGLQLEIEDLAQMAAERLAFSERQGVETWDAAWLRERFDLQPQPLPKDWRLLELDPMEIEAIGNTLNAFISPTLENPTDE